MTDQAPDTANLVQQIFEEMLDRVDKNEYFDSAAAYEIRALVGNGKITKASEVKKAIQVSGEQDANSGT